MFDDQAQSPCHEQEHKDGCGCGGGHGHAQEHGCNHVHHAHTHHNHNHHHEHEQTHSTLVLGEVAVQSHEGAQVATLQDSLQGDFQVLEARVSIWLETLAQRVMRADGTIGHIKASLSDGENVSMFSTTDGSVHAVSVSRAACLSEAKAQHSQAQLTLVAIIFNIEEEQLRRMVLDSKPEHTKNKTKKPEAVRTLFALLFSAVCIIGIITCVICDLAITGALTWSLYPISSIIFAWLVLFPSSMFSKKGLLCSLLVCTILVIPFVSVLDYLTGSGGFVLHICTPLVLIGVMYLWALFIVFTALKGKGKMLTALGIVLLLACVTVIAVNVSLSFTISEPVMDIWDVFPLVGMVVLAIVLFVIDYGKHKRANNC